MHRMWSDFRWNKLMLAHGCYWKRCTFCDIHLDYIGRFEPQTAARLADQMERIVAQTGSSGFHFVDEAAPPALLKALSREILNRGLNVTWSGNIRFDKQFTPELAALMAEAGCVAVSGGLEVASERLLRLIDKGVTIEQVARVTRSLPTGRHFCACLFDLRIREPNSARDGRLARSRPAVVCRRLSRFGNLAPFSRHRA